MRCRRLAVMVTALVALGGLASASTNDPGFAQQWALPLIGAEEGWSRTCGASTVVAVVDTGVDLDHEDLVGRLVAGRDFVDDDDVPQDTNGHGTHVAGVVAAATGNGAGIAGVSPEARIMPVRVLDANGRGHVEDVDAGIRWAADRGAHVINLSLGEDDQLPLSNLILAINYAWQRGSIPVLAAGDTTVGGSEAGEAPVIVVTATTSRDQLASYAQGVGSARWGMAAPGGQGEPSAFTERILSTYFDPANPGRRDAYAYLAGTSQAAPHVAGAAALLRGAGMEPQATVDRLLSSARDLGPAGRDSTYGSGRLDVAAATAGLNRLPCPFTAAGNTPPVTSPPPTTAAPPPSSTPTTTGAGTSSPPSTTTTTSPSTTTPSTIERGDPPNVERGDGGVVLADLGEDDGGGPGRWPAVPATGLAAGAGYLAWRQRRLLPVSVLARLPGSA